MASVSYRHDETTLFGGDIGEKARQSSRIEYPSIFGRFSSSQGSLPSHYDVVRIPGRRRGSTGKTIVAESFASLKHESMSLAQSPVQETFQKDDNSKCSARAQNDGAEPGKCAPPRRPDIAQEIEKLVGVTPTEYERYERNVQT